MKRTIIASTDDFTYRITYECIRRGKQSSYGFFPDMEYEIYDVEIGKDKTSSAWLLVPRNYIPDSQWAWIDEQVQEDVAEWGDE